MAQDPNQNQNQNQPQQLQTEQLLAPTPQTIENGNNIFNRVDEFRSRVSGAIHQSLNVPRYGGHVVDYHDINSSYNREAMIQNRFNAMNNQGYDSQVINSNGTFTTNAFSSNNNWNHPLGNNGQINPFANNRFSAPVGLSSGFISATSRKRPTKITSVSNKPTRFTPTTVFLLPHSQSDTISSLCIDFIDSQNLSSVNEYDKKSDVTDSIAISTKAIFAIQGWSADNINANYMRNFFQLMISRKKPAKKPSILVPTPWPAGRSLSASKSLAVVNVHTGAFWFFLRPTQDFASNTNWPIDLLADVGLISQSTLNKICREQDDEEDDEDDNGNADNDDDSEDNNNENNNNNNTLSEERPSKKRRLNEIEPNTETNEKQILHTHNDNCPICKDALTPNQSVFLACGHALCLTCLVKWSHNRVNVAVICPLRCSTNQINNST